MKLQRYLRHIKKVTALTIAIALLMLMTTGMARAEIFLSKFGAGQLANPNGIAVDPAGNIYVADESGVQKFDSAGNFLFQKAGITGAKVAADSQGNLYVSDPGNRLVQKFDSSGTLLLQIEPTCSFGIGNCVDIDGPGPRPPVYSPVGVAVDDFDRVYVIGTFHLQMFSSNNGSLLTEFSLGGIVPRSIAVDNLENVIIFEKDNGTINKYDPAGNLIVKFSKSGCDLASGLGCVDPDGPGPLELGDGQFTSGGPGGLATDASGNIYATDPGNGRVQKFSSTGQFLLKFGSAGTGDGQFGNVVGIAVDSSGKIYVTDSNNGVQIFGQGDSRSVNSATGAGTVTLSTNVGNFSSVTAVAEGSLPTAGKPTGVTFPYGFYSWTIIGLSPGQAITMTMNHPSAIATGAQYWKVIGGVWTNVTSLLGSDDGDNTLTLTITDGGLGDADGIADGQITDPGGVGVVAVQVPTQVPFEAFRAEADIDRGPRAHDDEFDVKAIFTLGTASNGINPTTEDVVLRLGSLTITIPAQSFRQDKKGRFKFEGRIGRVELEAKITPLGGNRFEFKTEGEGAQFRATAKPVVVELIIGDDGGSTTVTPDLHVCKGSRKSFGAGEK
jgi:beta-propeller repeat-containing protein/NHL repeat-containing protein